MWKKNKITPIERLRKNNKFLRSNLWFGFLLTGGFIILFQLLRIKRIIEAAYLDAEAIDHFKIILLTQGMNGIFISSCMTGVFFGAAFALRFRPKSKSEIIVDLSDKIESLEKKLNENT